MCLLIQGVWGLARLLLLGVWGLACIFCRGCLGSGLPSCWRLDLWVFGVWALPFKYNSNITRFKSGKLETLTKTELLNTDL